MNIQRDPVEKEKTFLSYIVKDVLDGDKEGAMEILMERYENMPGDIKSDLERLFFDQLNLFKEKLETENPSIEICPVLVVSASGDPDTGAFLVGCMDGEKPKFELVSFDYAGYPGYIHEVDRDSFYYSTY